MAGRTSLQVESDGITDPRSWQHTNTASPPSKPPQNASQSPLPSAVPGASKRATRWELRDGLFAISKVRRLQGCGVWARQGEAVEVHRVEEANGPRGTARGVTVCGSIWSCPVCSAHIRAVRAMDIALAVDRHLAAGGGLLFLTLTLRHHLAEGLDGLLDGLQESMRGTFSGAPWQRWAKRIGYSGRIASREITYGQNGWHPHGHLLLFLDAPLDQLQVVELEAWIGARWQRMVSARGLQLPDLDHGSKLEVVQNGDGAGLYLAKLQESASVALELSWIEAKRSRGGLMPFEILDAASQGERDALALWWEYEAVTKGRKCITWSPGLRDRLGLGEERSDEEIAEDDQTSEESLLLVVTQRDWRLVCRARRRWEVVRAAEHPLGREAAAEAVTAILQEVRGGP